MRSSAMLAPAARRAVVLAALLAVVALAPAPAWAGTEPVLADPPVGAVLVVAPTEVTLTFAEPVQLELSHVAVTDSSGADVSSADFRLPEPRLVSLPVRIVEAGDFTVAYHITFPDGTSTTGAYRFSFGTGVAPSPLDDATRLAATEAVAEHAHTIDSLSAVILLIDGAVLFAVLALLRLRPRGGGPMSLRGYREGSRRQG